MKRVIQILAIAGFVWLVMLSGRYVNTEAVSTEAVDFVPEVSIIPEEKTMNFTEYVAYSRDCITNWMEGELYVREQSNRNDHPRIDEYFNQLGWKNPEKLSSNTKAWCGAFMANAWLNCIGDIPWVNLNATLAQVRVWKTGPRIEKQNARPGDVVAITAHSHVEGIYEVHPNPTFKYLTVIGGNVSAPPGMSDKRQGVHKKTRTWTEVSRVISLEKTIEMSTSALRPSTGSG